MKFILVKGKGEVHTLKKEKRQYITERKNINQQGKKINKNGNSLNKESIQKKKKPLKSQPRVHSHDLPIVLFVFISFRNIAKWQTVTVRIHTDGV